MNYIESREILEKYSLISRKKSKKIIRYLNDQVNFSEIDKDIFKIVKIINIKKIKSEFEDFKKSNRIKKKINRNFELYEFIKNKNKRFDYEIINKNKIILKMPMIKSLRVSLSSIIFLNNDIFDQLDKIYSKYHFIVKTSKRNANFLEIQEFFQETKIKYPKSEVFSDFINLINKCQKSGENINLISPVCPDYSYKKLSQNFYTFTFKSLNQKIGLVAKNIILNNKKIKIFFNKINCNFNQKLLVGDFEAYEKQNLKKLKINQEEFLKRTCSTQKAIDELLNADNSFSFLDICGGFEKWKEVKNKFEQKFSNFDFMNANIDKDDFYNILLAREKIYKNWYPGLSQKENEKMLISQAAEYAAMGYFISRKYTNSIVIGSDHHVMSPFYRASSKNLVVLYIQKNYTT